MGKKTLLTQVKGYLKKLDLIFDMDEDNNIFSLSFDMDNTQVEIII